MQRQRLAEPMNFTVRDLTRDDLARLDNGERRTPTGIPQRFTDPHHRVARLLASGLRRGEVAKRCGYSMQRLYTLEQSPAFQELVCLYREKVIEAFVDSQEDFIEMATANMLKAQRMIAEQLDEADEAETHVPLKTLLAISADAADRVGYGKRQTNVNLNADFAKALERAYAEQSRVIESRVVPSARPALDAPPPAATGPAVAQVPNLTAGPSPSNSGAAPARRPEQPRAPDAGVTVERGAGDFRRRA